MSSCALGGKDGWASARVRRVATKRRCSTVNRRTAERHGNRASKQEALQKRQQRGSHSKKHLHIQMCLLISATGAPLGTHLVPNIQPL